MACGPFGKWGNGLVWDKPFGLDLTVPCKQHDEGYKHPNGKTKEEVDYLFYEMMLEEAAKSRWYLRAFHRKIAWAYYMGVSKTVSAQIAWQLCRLAESIAAVKAMTEG